ncbi:MAG: FG-GAP-like repeat-containing protein, partial [Planctomycetota bacterium]
AIQTLGELLIVDAGNTKAMFLLARCHAGLGRVEQAIEVLEQIPMNDAGFGLAALGQRAEYLSSLNRREQSVPLWRQILDVQPDLEPARLALAEDLFQLGRRIEFARMIAPLVRKGRASPDHLRRLVNVTDPPLSRAERVAKLRGKQTNKSNPTDLVRVWDHLSKRQIRQAFTVANTSAAKTSATKTSAAKTPVQTRVLKAWLAGELRDFAIARAVLAKIESDQLTKAAQDFPGYWLACGCLLESMGKLDAAIACYVEAMRKDPTHPWVHDRLSAALLKTDRVALARFVDERRFALAGPLEAIPAIGPGQPDDAEASQAIIEDLVRLGFPDQAASWLQHVAPRHRQIFGDAKAIENKVRELRMTSTAKRESKWFGPLDLTLLPDPQDLAQMLGTLSGAKLRGRNMASQSMSESPIRLPERSNDWNLNFRYQNDSPPKDRLLRLFEQVGGGAAAIDYDGDGTSDLYLAQAGNEATKSAADVSDSLFRNVGDRFVEVTTAAGLGDDDYTHGVAYGDWNQDGFWDLAIGNFGPNRLWINQGDGTFVPRHEWLGEDPSTMTTSVAIADLNQDGLPDWVETNYVDDASIFRPVPTGASGFPSVYVGPNKFRAGLDRVAIADASGQAERIALDGSQDVLVTEANAEAPAADVPRLGDAAMPGLGLWVDDLDGVPGLEVFVANDARPNQLWRHRPAGRGAAAFDEVAAPAGLATSGQGKSTACMGITAADFDRDGFRDLMVTNWYDEWSNLYRQKPAGLFQDVAPAFQLDSLSDHHVGFGLVAVDIDNNAWMDVVVGNGHVDDFSNLGIPQRQATQVLRNRGNRFQEVPMAASNEDDSGEDYRGQDYWNQGHLSRCVIDADFNRDGRIDVLITDLVDPVSLLINETGGDHAWVQVECIGTDSERSAIGARVTILDPKTMAPIDPPMIQSVAATAGYMGRGEACLHFGLGDWSSDKVSLQIRWPDGTEQPFVGLDIRRRHVLVQGQSLILKSN